MEGLPTITGSMGQRFIEQAVSLAVENVRQGGGPFGAVVVHRGVVIATGANQVTRTNDPTAHAEMVAIREACQALKTFQLTDCDLYTSCEPCPMCLGAIFWARLSRVFFAATHLDASAAGFDDSFIYQQIATPHSEREIPMIQVADPNATQPFQEWANQSERTPY